MVAIVFVWLHNTHMHTHARAHTHKHTCHVLQALEVTDGTTESTSPLVCNADALGLCLEWLLDLPHNLQQWLSRRVLDLCSFSVYNKQQCCGARLTSIAVKVLVRSQEDGGFCEDIEGQPSGPVPLWSVLCKLLTTKCRQYVEIN